MWSLRRAALGWKQIKPYTSLDSTNNVTTSKATFTSSSLSFPRWNIGLRSETLTGTSATPRFIPLVTSKSRRPDAIGIISTGNLFIANTVGQVRWRWTKAKKKRTARYQRRQEMVAQGQELPKPPYYFGRDTPVVNANPLSRDERSAEIAKHDAIVSQELNAKLALVQQQTTLLHHMSTPVSDAFASLDTNNESAPQLIMSDRVRRLLDLHNGNQRQVIQAQKHQGMFIFQKRPGDTGSSAVQVVALTTRIQQMQTHLQSHKKDKHSKRGMDALFIRRRKTLDYLERKDFESYRRVVKTLGLVR